MKVSSWHWTHRIHDVWHSYFLFWSVSSAARWKWQHLHNCHEVSRTLKVCACREGYTKLFHPWQGLVVGCCLLLISQVCFFCHFPTSSPSSLAPTCLLKFGVFRGNPSNQKDILDMLIRKYKILRTTFLRLLGFNIHLSNI